jgi:hypothetical protein
MSSDLRAVLVFFITAMTVIIFGIQTIATKEDAAACQRTLPANIELSPELERTLAKIYRGSATFRAQCERIAAATTLSVTLRLDTNIPRSCQAFTIINRRGRLLRADVHLPPAAGTLALLVGHEFEHIVEQLDGLDLRALARVRGSGVHESSFEVFESDRAERAGRVVAGEASTRKTAD